MIDVSYKTLYRRVQCSQEALDVPRPQLERLVEIDELHMKAELKGRERDWQSRSRGLSTRGRITYEQSKPPLFVLADRGTCDCYVLPAKAARESTIRLLLPGCVEKPLTVYTDGFRVYKPLDEDDAFTREYVVRGDAEHADGDVHLSTFESRGSLAPPWLSPH